MAYKDIKNFLTKELCETLIKKFKSYNGKYIKFQNRFLIRLKHFPEDNLFLEVIKKYEKPNIPIKNIEILFWPIGEFHNLHDDTIFYDITTITYLNEDYEGGRTVVEGTEIKPEIGKFIEFKSNKKHLVTQLTKGERYVLLCWYKNENK